LLDGASENGSLDAHAIQPFYAGMLARACGVKLELKSDGDTVIIAAA
jgi:histidine phosphotransferase ChpT